MCEITIFSSPDGITPIHAINDCYTFKSCPNFSSWDFMPILSQEINMLLELTLPTLGSGVDTHGFSET